MPKPQNPREVRLAVPKILLAEGEDKPGRRLAPAPDFGWSLLGWIGAVFFAVGFTDILLAFIPPSFGVAGWEFATIQRTYDFMPLTTMGLGLALGSAVAIGRRWWLFAVSTVLVVLGVLLVVAGVLYLLSVPFALQQVRIPVARTGLKRAILKAAVQGTLYPLVYLVLGAKGFRRALSGPKQFHTS